MSEESFDQQREENEDPFGAYFEGATWELPTDVRILGRAQDELQKRMSDICDESGERYWDEEQIFQISMGFHEALANAVVRGNMRISEKDSAKRSAEIERRALEYADKKVVVSLTVTADSVCIIITDEGEGFDVKKMTDPTDTEHREGTTGRGIFMMKSYFDTVSYNTTGNEVTLTAKRKQRTG